MVKRFLFLFITITLFVVPAIQAQDGFTKAYAKYRPYHYQTPQAWNRIRLEVADPQHVIWSLVEQEPRFMYLTGYWKQPIPSPVPENTYMFRELDEIGTMCELLMRPNMHGYLVYPIWMEEQVKLTEDKNFSKYILSKGYMNTLVTDLLYDVEDHLEEIVYTPDSVAESAMPPEVYGSNYMKHALSRDNYNLYNLKNYYCYFDNRPDSIRHKVKYTTRVTKAFNAEVDQLTTRIDSADLGYVMIPYWMTDVYLALPQERTSRIHRFGYPAYIINPLSGGIELSNNWNSLNVMDFAPYANTNYDLVIYCGDAHSTNTFLSNMEAQLQLVYNLFDPATGMIHRNGFEHKPSGIHVYFPEFDFTQKRQMTLFIKTLSMVIDNFAIGKDKVYSKLNLSITFPTHSIAQHGDYLSLLQYLTDTIYYADFDEYGLTSYLIYNDGSVDTSSLFSRFMNPFYLVRLPYQPVKEGVNDGDLLTVAQCSYRTTKWELFLIIDIVLILLLLLTFILRFTSPIVNRYMELYPTGMRLLSITLIMEIFVFLYFTIEALSLQVIFFNFDADSSGYLFLIALPIIPIWLYFLFQHIYKDRPIP